ncbi:MAG: hypothetical protein ACKKMS_00130 [Candidatus Nealsonbacteria bacterium]
MSVETFFNKVVLVRRLVPDDSESPEDTEEYREHLGGINVPCLVYPLDDSYGEDFSGSYGKDLMMICNIYDIKEKDKIIEGENEYEVKGVKEFNFLGTSLMELRIRLMPTPEES